MNLTKEQLYEFKNSLRTLISEVANMDSVVEMALELVELKEKKSEEDCHGSSATQAVSHVEHSSLDACINAFNKWWPSESAVVSFATWKAAWDFRSKELDQMRDQVKRAEELIKSKDKAIEIMDDVRRQQIKIINSLSPQLKGESNG